MNKKEFIKNLKVIFGNNSNFTVKENKQLVESATVTNIKHLRTTQLSVIVDLVVYCELDIEIKRSGVGLTAIFTKKTFKSATS